MADTLITDAMLEAGTSEATDWLPRYAEMATSDIPGLCRAIYAKMNAARTIDDAPDARDDGNLLGMREALEGLLAEIGDWNTDAVIKARKALGAQ